jgi:hypothetical protein
MRRSRSAQLGLGLILLSYVRTGPCATRPQRAAPLLSRRSSSAAFQKFDEFARLLALLAFVAAYDRVLDAVIEMRL